MIASPHGRARCQLFSGLGIDDHLRPLLRVTLGDNDIPLAVTVQVSPDGQDALYYPLSGDSDVDNNPQRRNGLQRRDLCGLQLVSGDAVGIPRRWLGE